MQVQSEDASPEETPDGSAAAGNVRSSAAPLDQKMRVSRNSIRGRGSVDGGKLAEEKKANPTGTAAGGGNMFANADNMRAELMENIAKKDYDVMDYYHESGCAQHIARSGRFGNFTLVVIGVNALWMGFDAECNDSQFEKETGRELTGCPATHEDTTVWLVGENVFCAFFTFELLVRFFAFQKKISGFRDHWFKFDSVLVFMMVVETWIIPIFAGGSADALSDMSLLRMMRLLRLTRMVRLMRSVPELLTLFKGMRLAFRSVSFTLMLLLIVMYIFGIIFKSQLESPDQQQLTCQGTGSPLISGGPCFMNIPRSMFTLFLSGCILDNITYVSRLLVGESILLAFLFLIFVLVSSLMVLNMLIGILCAVVTAVAVSEREKTLISFVKSKLINVLTQLDEDGNGTISKSEFDELLNYPEATSALTELGVDINNLVSLADHLFAGDENTEHVRLKSSHNEPKDAVEGAADGELAGEPPPAVEEEEEVSLTFADFLEMVIRLRGNNPPSVADVVDLRKLVSKGHRQALRRLHHLERGQQDLQRGIRLICEQLDQQWSNVQDFGVRAGTSISEPIDH